MKELVISRENQKIEVHIDTVKICSVDVDNKVINGADLYKAYSWDIDEKYELSKSSVPIQKDEQEMTNLDYLHRNVFQFFSGLIQRMDEERTQVAADTSQYETELKERVEKVQIIVDEGSKL